MGTGANRRLVDLVDTLFGFFVALPMICSFLTGSVVLLLECVKWLKVAVWETITLRHAVYWWTGELVARPARTGWLGADRGLDWIFTEMSLPFILMVTLPLAWLLISLWFWGRVEKLISPRRA